MSGRVENVFNIKCFKLQTWFSTCPHLVLIYCHHHDCVLGTGSDSSGAGGCRCDSVCGTACPRHVLDGCGFSLANPRALHCTKGNISSTNTTFYSCFSKVFFIKTYNFKLYCYVT